MSVNPKYIRMNAQRDLRNESQHMPEQQNAEMVSQTKQATAKLEAMSETDTHDFPNRLNE